MKKKMLKKIVAYVMTITMIGGAVALNTTSNAKASVKTSMSAKDYRKMCKDHIDKFFKAPEVTYSVFDHGYIFPRNVLNIKFTEVKYARSYDVMISKDDKFEKTKIYNTKKNTLFLSTDTDDFITPSSHGRHVKVRANYRYGIHGKWSESKMIGCGKLHLH